MVLVTCLACVLFLFSDSAVLSGSRQEKTESRQEVRALWVTRSTLTSPDAIAELVQTAQAGGFNTLVVQVRGRGDAYYQSTLEPRPGALAARPEFDPLQEVLTRAKPAGLAVHAWMNVNLVASATDLPSSRHHVVHRHPEWLMVPRQLAAELQSVEPSNPDYVGRLARWARANRQEVEGLYTSPLQEPVAAHVAAVAADIASRYAVDGIHLDYTRFPSAGFDYSRIALQQFKAIVRPRLSEAERRRADAQEQLDPAAYPNLYPERWTSYRQSRLTALVMRVRTAVKTARPEALLSVAVVPDVTEAALGRLQDWRTWMDQSLVDVLCPMAYATDFEEYERQVATVVELAGAHRVWAGVGAYRLSPMATLRHVAAARRHEPAGVILFSYDALTTPPHSAASLADLGRAAFGVGSH